MSFALPKQCSVGVIISVLRWFRGCELLLNIGRPTGEAKLQITVAHYCSATHLRLTHNN